MEVISAVPAYLMGLDERTQADDALVRALQQLAGAGTLGLPATQLSTLLGSGNDALAGRFC